MAGTPMADIVYAMCSRVLNKFHDALSRQGATSNLNRHDVNNPIPVFDVVYCDGVSSLLCLMRMSLLTKQLNVVLLLILLSLHMV